MTIRILIPNVLGLEITIPFPRDPGPTLVSRPANVNSPIAPLRAYAGGRAA